MNRTQARQSCRNLADNLRSLADVLVRQGLIVDSGSLYGAASQVQTCHQEGQSYWWRYDFGPLIFSLESSSFKNVHPKSARVLSLELSGSVSGWCLDEGAEEDPFRSLTIDIFIEGEAVDGSLLACAWHLDRDENGGGVGEFCHPVYHFQYGGKRLWEIPGFDYGAHLLLESPRNAHPPLDAVLAVDYVVSNFLGHAHWLALRQDATYQQLLIDSSECFLKPYARSLAASWSTIQLTSAWRGSLLWPLLP